MFHEPFNDKIQHGDSCILVKMKKMHVYAQNVCGFPCMLSFFSILLREFLENFNITGFWIMVIDLRRKRSLSLYYISFSFSLPVSNIRTLYFLLLPYFIDNISHLTFYSYFSLHILSLFSYLKLYHFVAHFQYYFYIFTFCLALVSPF